MTASRHGAPGGQETDTSAVKSGPASARISDTELLDAARQCVLAVGVRRTTLAEIARTAEVSRMTVYRRFSDVHSVLAALMTREFGTLLEGARAQGDAAANAREHLIASATATIRELAVDELMRTILTIDPQLVLPYVVQRLGATQRLAEGIIGSLLDAGHADGSIRSAPRAAQARSILLIVQSFVFSLYPATWDVDESFLLNEFHQILDGALRPESDRP